MSSVDELAIFRGYSESRARESLEFLLSGQEPPFEVRFRAHMGRPLWVETVEEVLASGADYFGLVGRKRVRTGSGLGRQNTAERTNLIWLDLDAPDEVVEREPLLHLAEQRLNLFEVLDLLPSAYHFSGQGSWAFWKLNELIPTSEAERLNKRLARQFRPEEGSEWNADRVARLPGAWHQATGQRAFVMALTKLQWSPSVLDALLEPLVEAHDDAALHADVQPEGNPPILLLSGDLAAYVCQKPTKADRRARGIDGSAVEQRIVCLLVNEGYTDGEIARYFDHHRLPRHREEVQRRRGKYSWLERGITAARRRRWAGQEGGDYSFFSPSTPPPVSKRNDTYGGEGAETREQENKDNGVDEGVGGRHPYWYARRWLVLTQLVGDKTSTELQQEIMARFDVGKSTAIRDINWLQAREYIEKQGRGKPVIRTEKADRRIADWGQRIGVPFEFTARSLSAETVSKHTGSGPTEEVEHDEAVETGTVRRERGRRHTRRSASPRGAKVGEIDDELRWQEIERKRRKRNFIDDKYRISLLGQKRVFYLQLLTPPEEWHAVRFHEQLRVGVDNDGFPIYQSFISPKDPALDGPNGFDPIEERGQLARDRVLAYGVELEKTTHGLQFVHRFEQGRTDASVGLVVQARFNFFQPLDSLGPRVTERVLKVKRTGSGKRRMFQFEDAGHALPLDVPAFDLAAFLDRLADEERLHTFIDPLPRDWRFY